MNIGWRHYPLPMSGLARGYLASAFYLHRALKAQLGMALVDVTETSECHPHTVLHYCPPHFYERVPGKRNVLFTMWESPVLPPDVRAQLASADVRVVPSTFCRDVWRTHGLDATVVPLGVAPEFLDLDPTRPLVDDARVKNVLWVGSKSQRKGWGLVGALWAAAWSGVIGAKACLCIKTIGDGTVARVQQGGRDLDAPVVIDQRDLEPGEMLTLYQQADVILSTSFSEGFGLPVLEGMAAGALAIVPQAPGLEDFAVQHAAIVAPLTEEAAVDYGAVRVRMRYAHPVRMGHLVRRAIQGWGSPAVESIRRAGVVRARRMTWDATATALRAALEPALKLAEAPTRRAVSLSGLEP